jgi:hypothetical protein
MRILSLKEAGALVGRNTEQLRKLINAGQLACLRSEGGRTPIYVTDEAMRAAGFSLPENLDAGDPSVETLVRGLMDDRARELLQTIAEQRRKIEILKTRVHALESVHADRGGTAHCLPPQAS